MCVDLELVIIDRDAGSLPAGPMISTTMFIIECDVAIINRDLQWKQ